MANPQKEVRELVKAAKRQGWRVKQTKEGYLLLDPSGRHKELLHQTPSDPRGLRDSLSRMRRFGFEMEGQMTDFRFEALIQGRGTPDAVDDEAMRLLEVFEELHPGIGLAIGIDVGPRVLEVGFYAGGKSLEEAAERARQMLREAADAARWKSLDVISFESQPEEADQALAS